jgi:tocopherol O-methyltransferase
MITPKTEQTGAAVSCHYDELDTFYRDIWGDHVHHGYWQTGRETSSEAAAALSHLVAKRLDVKPGMILCDIGCGYGATARLMAAAYGAEVKGVTISSRQFEVASAVPAPGVSISLRDWIANDFAPQSFDGAYAIESSEHIADKAAFFKEAYKVLKPGGRLVICAWLAGDVENSKLKQSLLERICRQGRLPGMASEAEYEELGAAAGLNAVSSEAITRQVQRTWAICLQRLARKAVTDRRYIAHLFSPKQQNRVFAITMALILAAYKTGAMKYSVMVFERPA